MSNRRFALKDRFIISILITTLVVVVIIFGSVINNNSYIVSMNINGNELKN
jgi:hypothetical protein